MTQDGPRYDYSAVAAAQILNTLDTDMPKADKFGRILFIVLDAMYLAETELKQLRATPSKN